MNETSNRETSLPIPNGWFAVAFSKDLIAGEVKRMRYFDEDLVLFRTRDGHARVLDAYCPHLGAHLGEGGKVIGESIRCPFHFWHFDGDGHCTQIPYSKKIPPRARLRAWPVAERNKMIFVWHHAEGKPPEWEVEDCPELVDPAWTDARYFELEVDVHMQDMAENNCDPAHFHYVHGADAIPESEISYGQGGRYMRVYSEGEKETPMGAFTFGLERETWGLGLSSVRMTGIPNAGLLLYSSTSPVDAHKTISRWVFTVSRNMADLAGEPFIEGLTEGVKQDLRIWRNKIHRPDPVLCEADVFLGEFRRWAKQFYSKDA